MSVVLTYAYDAPGQIEHLVNPQDERTTFAHDAAGRRTVKKLDNGSRALFSYDDANNLTVLANIKSDNTTISSFEYAYDGVGNRFHVVEANGDRVTWTYDNTYQLTREKRSGANSYDTTYIYDAVGNRHVKIADARRTTSTYNAANKIETSVDPTFRTIQTG